MCKTTIHNKKLKITKVTRVRLNSEKKAFNYLGFQNKSCVMILCEKRFKYYNWLFLLSRIIS